MQQQSPCTPMQIHGRLWSHVQAKVNWNINKTRRKNKVTTKKRKNYGLKNNICSNDCKHCLESSNKHLTNLVRPQQEQQREARRLELLEVQQEVTGAGGNTWSAMLVTVGGTQNQSKKTNLAWKRRGEKGTASRQSFEFIPGGRKALLLRSMHPNASEFGELVIFHVQ